MASARRLLLFRQNVVETNFIVIDRLQDLAGGLVENDVPLLIIADPIGRGVVGILLLPVVVFVPLHGLLSLDGK